MNKKILIISSDHTGHGHKSITESLCETINKNDVDFYVVDGFSLGGKLLLKIGKSYGPITRYSGQLWKMIWNFSAASSSLVNKFVEQMIKKNLLKTIEKVQPDLILSVHPNFNGSVINILEKNNINIPFTTFIADLVNIYPLWADKRADMIISPTEEAKQKCLEFGIPEEKISVFGFPVRSRFFRKDTENKANPSTLQFLIMSGGEGVGNMKAIAEMLLTHFDCKVKIVAGRNAELKVELEESLNKFGDKVDIFGFITNIQDLMHTSDIAFTRGSPNVMYEAFASNLPIIITGALPGQEEDNPLFATQYNLGIICNNTNNIKNTIHELIANDYEKWHSIKNSQQEFINSHTAKDITDFLIRFDRSHSLQEENYSSLIYSTTNE